MSERWRSGAATLSWVMVAVCAALAVVAMVQWSRGDGGWQILSSVPTGVSLAVLVTVVAQVVVSPASAQRRTLGLVAALVLVAATVIDLGNAAAGFSDGDNLGAWRSLALAVVPLAAAVGVFAATWAPTGISDPRAVESRPASAPLERSPSWSADQAVGASWTRAGDAATGAPASGSSGAGWGVPGAANESSALAESPGSDPTPPDTAQLGIARPVPGVPTAADWVSGTDQTAEDQPPTTSQP